MIAGIAASFLTAPASFLQVQGRLLVHKDRPVVLKGVCIGDILLSRAGRPLSDYRTIAKEWKANTVRIGVAPSTVNEHGLPFVMADLKKEVGAALKEGLFVIIDWHTIGWPDGYTQVIQGAPADLYDSRISLAESFWKEAAKAFKKEGKVGFQLWCEPVRQADDWRNPLGSSWPILKPTWERLTKVIRGEGAQNLILQTGGRWAYDLKGVKSSLMSDANTAYHWHVYAGHDDNDPQRWDAALDGLHLIRPVVVSEWGFQEDTTGHFKGSRDSFGLPFVKFMNARGLHGLAWCWHNTWGPTMFEKDFKTPSSWGKFVQDWLGGRLSTSESQDES